MLFSIRADVNLSAQSAIFRQ